MKKITNRILFNILGLLLLFSSNTHIFADSVPAIDFNTAKSLYYVNIESCFASFIQLVNTIPDSEPARMDLIRILREKGRYKEAISHIKILQQQNPHEKRYRLALLEATYLAGEPWETVREADYPDLSADELYWKGLALAELGQDSQAIQVLTDAVADEPYNPMAYCRLGQVYLRTGEYEKAVLYLKKAAAQDPGLSEVFYPLAQAYLELGKFVSAYAMFNNAKYASPWNQNIGKSIKKLLTEHPEILAPQTGVQKPQPITTPMVTPILEKRETIPEIRIGLAEKILRFQIKTGANFSLKDWKGNLFYAGKADSILVFKKYNGRIYVSNTNGKLLFKWGGSVYLTYENPAATTAVFEVRYLNGSYWAGRTNRVYRGTFQFIPKNSRGITIVNRLNLEEYLYGVVPSEMESHWPAAALEAQAIAARTYAIANMKAFNSRGFDLLPTVASQVYNGVNVERPSSNAAVDATRGRIVTYKDKIINAFYTGNTGGYSASSKDLWGVDIGYLKAIPDLLLPPQNELLRPEELAKWLTSWPKTYSCNPQYSARRHYRWAMWIPRQVIEKRLFGNKKGDIDSIIVAGRSLTGVVSKVKVKTTLGVYTLTGDKIRGRLGGLRSNMFIVEPKFGSDGQPEYFIFWGGGWGHGVGMCQSGAAGMAADGYKNEDILSHYYPGTEILQKY